MLISLIKKYIMLSRLLFNTKFYFIKILFLDKYILRTIKKNDPGIFKAKNTYFVDIPKVGSSSLKYLAAKESKRFNILKKFFHNVPIHPAVIPVQNLKKINNENKIFIFIKSPDERLYSVYKEKVHFSNFLFDFSILKFGKLKSFKNSIKIKYKFNKDNNFLDFCEGIIRLNNYLHSKNLDTQYFDKHIISQYDHIINLRKIYPNIINFKIIIYPISKIDNVLQAILNKKEILKLNTTKKINYDYKNDIINSNIINEIYKKDEKLYKKLISSENGFLEMNYSSFFNL